MYLGTFLALTALSGTARAQEIDAKTKRALNNVQHEMSTCCAYYNLMAQCIGNQDSALTQQCDRNG
jgi:hypothetical protein